MNFGPQLTRAAAASCLLSICACSVTYPVAGYVDRTGEKFVGTATSTTGTSHYRMSSDNGAICSGTYIAPKVANLSSGVTIEGTGTCTDGRGITWAASGTAVGGQGFGRVGNEKFTIFYGQFATYQQVF